MNKEIILGMQKFVSQVKSALYYEEEWGSEFLISHIRESFLNFEKSSFSSFEWTKLTQDDLRFLGFSKYEIAPDDFIWLIPGYLESKLKLAAPDVEIISISGERLSQEQIAKEKCELRFGCLAYGIRLK